ncbi:hypothetical protein SAMN05216259_102470 [Actinacidiphila guanduensis]|uniref:MalT-like TPR region domain-containing protein n=1 Tax=Actinacidiphila guanduensis TaxID=310781 RepID=A0A1G9YA18_9ACTN|nr:hypothetical protein SAMN05216259_102470 [Actinacidiphila guanduensis]
MRSGRRNQHVFPLLRRTYTEEVRGALCEAAAEQTYLLGCMAYDNGEHGIAQRYLVQSLRLSEESRNPALGAHVLAGMADQATLLGKPEEGRRLAQAGRAGLAKGTSPVCLADLWAVEARALAMLGDRAGAAHAIVQSESPTAASAWRTSRSRSPSSTPPTSTVNTPTLSATSATRTRSNSTPASPSTRPAPNAAPAEGPCPKQPWPPPTSSAADSKPPTLSACAPCPSHGT